MAQSPAHGAAHAAPAEAVETAFVRSGGPAAVSRAELAAHAEMMKKFPGMEHDEPYMAHVDPGQTGSVVWQFTQAGEFHFACLLPGHYEAGMVGRIEVKE